MITRIILLFLIFLFVFKQIHSQSSKPTTVYLSPRQYSSIPCTFGSSYDYVIVDILVSAENDIDIYAMTQSQFTKFQVLGPQGLPFEYIEPLSKKGVKLYENKIQFNERNLYLVIFNPGLITVKVIYTSVQTPGKNPPSNIKS